MGKRAEQESVGEWESREWEQRQQHLVPWRGGKIRKDIHEFCEVGTWHLTPSYCGSHTSVCMCLDEVGVGVIYQGCATWWGALKTALIWSSVLWVSPQVRIHRDLTLCYYLWCVTWSEFLRRIVGVIWKSVWSTVSLAEVEFFPDECSSLTLGVCWWFLNFNMIHSLAPFWEQGLTITSDQLWSCHLPSSASPLAG